MLVAPLYVPINFLAAPLLIAASVGGAFLLRGAVAWRPRRGAGFARTRHPAAAFGIVLAAFTGLVLPIGFWLTMAATFLSKNEEDRAEVQSVANILIGIGLLLGTLAVALLVLGLRAYPRLTVNADGITYRPDSRYTYTLPWAELARVDLASLAPHRPPSLIAAPLPGSELADGVAPDGRWRPDLNALVFDELDRLTANRPNDLNGLAQALGYYRAAAAAAPTPR